MNSKPALFTVFLVVLVDLMGFGIVLPLLPFFAAKFSASPVEIGLLYSGYSFMQLVFSPLWGAWSDRIGRRPIMLVSTFGSFVSYLMFAFCGSLPMLFASRLLAGLMGGNISAAQAAVADLTPPQERARGMGLIGAAFGIGFMMGPALAALLSAEVLGPLVGPQAAQTLSEQPFLLPGLFAASLSACSFVMVWTRLPETRVAGGGAADGLRVERSSVFSGAFWRTLSGGSSSRLRQLLAATALLAIGQSALYSAFPLFCESMLSMDAHAIAMQFAAMGLTAVIIQGGLIRQLTKRFPEHRLFGWGCLLMTLGLALIPVARSTEALTSFLVLMAVGGSLNGPTLTSLVSKEAGPQRYGSIIGSAQGLSALGRVIGPTWGGILFAWGAPVPFWATAGLVSATIWIASRLRITSGGSS